MFQSYARIAFALLAVLLLVSVSTVRSDTVAKHLSGSPSEFAANAIPSPLAAAAQESSSFLTASAHASSADNVDSESIITLPVDSTSFFSFAIFTQTTTSYSIKLVDPNGNVVQGLLQNAVVEKIEFGSDTVKTVTYGVVNPIVGEYVLHVQYADGFISFKQSNPRNSSLAFIRDFAPEGEVEIDVVVLLYNQSPYQIFSHVSTYKSVVGAPISVLSQLSDFSVESFDRSASPLKRPTPLKKSMFKEETIEVELSMAHPDGFISQIPMEDMIAANGFAEEDGVFVATFNPIATGNYYARVKFSATLDDVNQTQIVRTTQQVIAVVREEVKITGAAVAKIEEGKDQIKIYVEVDTNYASSTPLRPYAQVWGTSSDGSIVPVCWVSTIASTLIIDGNHYLQMELNSNWLSLAEAQFPIYLRNVTVQDTNTYLVMSEYTEIPVTVQDKSTLSLINYRQSSEVTITDEMLFGVRPSNLVPEVAAAEGTTGKLILVHGYCAPSNPWIEYNADFTNADYVEFLLCADSNNVFATKIDSFAKSKGYTSYSLAGYSQGGMATTELRTKFWSGADIPTNGKVLQSVVTPYKGQTLAGTTANLGKIFGVGCGSVYDLTLDGANLWATTIPTSIRSGISFYYVQFGDKGFNTRYCNAALNTQLDKPNDGVTEVSKASFVGANNMGVTVGECHTKDMKYPPAFGNSARNKQISGFAARS
jgi:hypothetical protein